jgi:hypothetical protein
VLLGDHLFLEHHQAQYGRLDTPLAQAGRSLANEPIAGREHSPEQTTRRLQLADSSVGPFVGPNAAVPDRIELDPITVHGIQLG